MIVTKDDYTRALERLQRRDPQVLAAFILSLARESGPVGQQVRTFIVGDDVADAAKSVRDRIRDLSVPSEYDYRHGYGREIGQSLAFIVESIESLVLPFEPRLAFELLVAVFDADARAMEQCGEHHWKVECAFERAAGVMAKAATSLPRADVAETITTLTAVDGYGMRAALARRMLNEPG